jgi:hypothetical protein
MNRFFHPISFALLAAFLFTGCTSVTSRKPVGDQPVTLDPKVWNGVWTDDDEAVLLMRVKDATNGIVEVAVPEIGDDGISLETMDVQVRQTDDWWWASFKDRPESAFTFLRVSQPDRHLLVWSPRPAAFAKRVKEGALEGTLLKDDQGKESGSVVLEELKAEHLRAIESGAWPDALDLGEPMILRRLGPKPGS